MLPGEHILSSFGRQRLKGVGQVPFRQVSERTGNRDAFKQVQRFPSSLQDPLVEISRIEENSARADRKRKSNYVIRVGLLIDYCDLVAPFTTGGCGEWTIK